MNARSLMQRWLPSRSQDEFLAVESESPATLTLRQGRVVTAFDRLSRTVTQQGKLVARFGAIRHVQVHQEGAQAGALEWWVSLQLAGTGSVKVGRCPEPSSAAQLAARIGSVTGVSVVS
jgi:hypothetical protein